MRDDYWLKTRLDNIWELLFPEVPKENNVVVRFKGKWRNKFGHIKQLRNRDSEIVVNGYFKNEVVPEYIVDLTLAHELVHYMHGFNSPLPKQFKNPHAGGIVERELKNRGFGHLILQERKWVKEDWPRLLKEVYKPTPRKRVVRRFFGFRF